MYPTGKGVQSYQQRLFCWYFSPKHYLSKSEILPCRKDTLRATLNPANSESSTKSPEQAQLGTHSTPARPGLPQVQPRLSPGSAQVQPRLSPGSAQTQPRFTPGSWGSSCRWDLCFVQHQVDPTPKKALSAFGS